MIIANSIQAWKRSVINCSKEWLLRNTHFFNIIFIILILSYFLDSGYKITEMYSSRSYTQINSPFVIKLVRDIFAFLLISMMYFFHTERKNQIINIFLLLLIFLTLIDNPLMQIFSGLRFFIPFIIFITPFQNKKNIYCFSLPISLIWGIFIIHLFLQIVNFTTGTSVHGLFPSGLSSRSVGLEFSPSGTSFLSFALFALISSYYFKLNRFSFLALLFLLASVTLSASLMGGVVFLLVALFYVIKMNNIQKITLLALILLSFTFIHASRQIGGGEQYLNVTGGGRISILMTGLDPLLNQDFEIKNSNFGLYTSWNPNGGGRGVTMDSFYATLLYNLNPISLVIVLSLFVYYIFTMGRRGYFKNKEEILPILIFLLCSISLITTEMYFPFFLLLYSKLIYSSNKEIVTFPR